VALRLAYLCDQYPAISHTFVLREIEALRRLGAEIATVSIRRSDPAHLKAAADRREFETTYALLPVGVTTLLRVHLGALARQPRRYVATLLWALRTGRGSARGRLWQLFYFAEAVLVWDRLRREGVTHVHAHFTSPAADVAMTVARLGRGWSYSFSAHGTDIQTADQGLLAEKVRNARFVVCVSDFGRSQLMTLVDDEHWPKIHVVRCGIDLAQFDGDRGTADSAGELQILNVGRLHPVKGQAVLLDALKLLLDGGVAARLTIVGDGERRDALERRAGKLGVTDSVTFAGNVGQDDIRAYYERADAFCLPSFGEGIPVVLMEAMAMRVAVVSSRIMGIPELVEDEVGGLLVPPGRPDLLAAALRRLAEDRELRERLARRGHDKVAADHDGSRAAEQLGDLFASAVER
jgi:colanic acid/amylovoran biosynthesis glycosyltransferase